MNVPKVAVLLQGMFRVNIVKGKPLGQVGGISKSLFLYKLKQIAGVVTEKTSKLLAFKISYTSFA